MLALCLALAQESAREPLVVAGVLSGESCRTATLEPRVNARRLRVLDAFTGRPLVGVDGELWVGDQVVAHARSGRDGGLVLPEPESWAESRPSFVFLSAPGYRRSLACGTDREHALFLRGPRLEFVVRSCDGAPIAGAELTARQAPEAPPTVRATSAADGSVVLDEFPPLHHGLRLEVRAEGYEPRAGHFSEALEPVPTIELARLGNAEEMRRVLDDDRAPVGSSSRRTLTFAARSDDGRSRAEWFEFHTFQDPVASHEESVSFLSAPSSTYFEGTFVDFDTVPVSVAGRVEDFPRRTVLRAPRRASVRIEGAVTWVRGPGFEYRGDVPEEEIRLAVCSLGVGDDWGHQEYAPGPCSLHVELLDGRAYDLELDLRPGEERTLSFF